MSDNPNVDANGYLKPGAPGTGAPPSSAMTRAQHIEYRRPVTEARHAREAGAAHVEQAWRERAAGNLDSTALPDGADITDLPAPYGATWDPESVEVRIGHTLLDPTTKRFVPNPEYYSAVRSGFIQMRGQSRSPQFQKTGQQAQAEGARKRRNGRKSRSND